MSFFDEKTDIRITQEQKAKIEAYVLRYPDRWENTSHFVRSALERQFRALASEEGVWL